MARSKLGGALGVYIDRLEFQVDRVLVNIEIPQHGNRTEWVAQGEKVFDEVWGAIPDVLSLGEGMLGQEFGEDWIEGDGKFLSVYGIWINPTTSSAAYHLAENPDFRWPTTPPVHSIPEDYEIWIRRDSKGILSIED